MFRNIADLAKAAVSGDETALDMFANYKSNATGRMKLPVGRMEGLSFYVGLANGKFFLFISEYNKYGTKIA